MMGVLTNAGAGMGGFGIGIGEAFGAVNAVRNASLSDYEQYQQKGFPQTQPRIEMDGYNFNIRQIDNGIIVTFAHYQGARVKEVFCANATEVSEQIVRILVEQKLEK